ncbi:hypothetical protein J6590_066131 [Homalodisca vitripennis]|nr:hypothetical protein J6590_066131 [Homalodisca vitripennis]
MAEWSKTLDFGSELETAQNPPLFFLIRSSHRSVAHEDEQNKSQKGIGFSFFLKKKFSLLPSIVTGKYVLDDVMLEYLEVRDDYWNKSGPLQAGRIRLRSLWLPTAMIPDLI